MAGVRRKRTQKQKRVNSTVTGRKLKKKNKVNLNIISKSLRQKWDQSKTLRQNFKDVGLSYNPNTTLPIRKKKGEDDELMEVDKVPPPNSVIEELEAEASHGCKKEKHIAPGEAKFLWELIKDHGDNYKKMSLDKRNYYQHTENQLKRKCTKFLNSSQDFSAHLNQA